MPGSIFAWIVVGSFVGWLASVIVRGTGIGVVGDVLVGVIGAVMWSVVVALIGAMVLLLLLRLLGISTRGPTRH
jgi:uncharacterized membrane protein YeaQ/YmgE (transglycosylase-associated protein family)